MRSYQYKSRSCQCRNKHFNDKRELTRSLKSSQQIVWMIFKGILWIYSWSDSLHALPGGFFLFPGNVVHPAPFPHYNFQLVTFTYYTFAASQPLLVTIMQIFYKLKLSSYFNEQTNKQTKMLQKSKRGEMCSIPVKEALRLKGTF